MIETNLRLRVQPAFDYLGSLLITHVTHSANAITLCACITGFLASYCIAIAHFNMALFLLLCSGICDILDGTVARLLRTSHKLGAYLDLISDRMVEASIMLGFAYRYPQHQFTYLLFLTALLFHFSTFVVAGALWPNNGSKSMHYDISFIERAEAFIIFMLMLLFPDYNNVLLMALNGAIFATGYTRLLRVIRYASSSDSV